MSFGSSGTCSSMPGKYLQSITAYLEFSEEKEKKKSRTRYCSSRRSKSPVLRSEFRPGTVFDSSSFSLMCADRTGHNLGLLGQGEADSPQVVCVCERERERERERAKESER